MKHTRQPLVPAFICILIALATAGAQEPAVDPKADALLKQMSAALTAAKSFSFESHAIADQVLPSGQKVQFARNQKVAVRRPDRIRAAVNADIEDFTFLYDGKQVTLFNTRAGVYASTDAPGTIDETLDMLATKYSMAIPLADMVFADPYKSLIERVRSAQDLGPGYVFDVKCHHLAFRQEIVDWQIWIDDANLPRKIVITYKEQPGHPQYTAFLNNWNLSTEIPEAEFTFTAPATAKKVDFAAPPSATQPAGAGK